MTMRDLHNPTAVVRAVRPQTITSSNIASAGIDLQGFNAAEIVVEFGDIDEMGGSPVGAAKVDTQLEHSDDDVTYADVALADVIGPASVSGGIVSSVTTDAAPVEVGYLGEKRYIRLTLKPTGLTNGGAIAALVIKGHPRHAPQ